MFRCTICSQNHRKNSRIGLSHRTFFNREGRDNRRQYKLILTAIFIIIVVGLIFTWALPHYNELERIESLIDPPRKNYTFVIRINPLDNITLYDPIVFYDIGKSEGYIEGRAKIQNETHSIAIFYPEELDVINHSIIDEANGFVLIENQDYVISDRKPYNSRTNLDGLRVEFLGKNKDEVKFHFEIKNELIPNGPFTLRLDVERVYFGTNVFFDSHIENPAFLLSLGDYDCRALCVDPTTNLQGHLLKSGLETLIYLEPTKENTNIFWATLNTKNAKAEKDRNDLANLFVAIAIGLIMLLIELFYQLGLQIID